MKNQIYFSIAQYVPDALRDERINFGFVYFYPADKKFGFVKSKNTNRLLAFDDELTKESLHLIQASLSYEFSIDSLEYDDNEEIVLSLLNENSSELLEYKIQNYINQIQFKNIQALNVDSSSENPLESAIKDISDIYLYFDVPKTKRKMNRDRVKQLTKKIIVTHVDKSLFEISKNDDKVSFYNRPFDFIIHGKSACPIKSMSLNYNNYYISKEFKSFIFDLDIYNDKYNLEYKPTIVLNDTSEYKNDFVQDIIQMLDSKGLPIVYLSELPDFLEKQSLQLEFQ